MFIPVFAGEYAVAECAGRNKYTIKGKEYDECAFCRASCPSRADFKEPDSGTPLKCDICEGEAEPLCVKWCYQNVLTYDERKAEVDEDEAKKRDEIEAGLELLTARYGIERVVDTVTRMMQKDTLD
jgi:benzoyl-CoA reductase subunit BamC